MLYIQRLCIQLVLEIFWPPPPYLATEIWLAEQWEGEGNWEGKALQSAHALGLFSFFFFFPSRRNNVIWFWTDCWLFTLLSSLHTFLHLLHNTMWHCINCLRAWCHVLSCSLVTKHLEYWGKNEKHLSKKKLILVSENSAQMTAHSRCQHDVN